MRRSARFASLLAGWAALSAAAPGQPAAQPPEPAAQAAQPAAAPTPAGAPTTVRGVVVTAPRRPPLTDLPRAISQYGRSHGAITRPIGQLARWGEPVCVTTAGLDPEFNSFISNRIQEVAAGVGAPTPKAGVTCETNIEIIFSNDPQDVALKLFKRSDALMGYHFAAEVPRLRKFEPPIKAWYATGTRGSGGQLYVDSIWTQTVGGGLGSRLTTRMSSEFVNVLVIADTKQMIGDEVGPVSDYLAMLVLTQPRSLTACDALPSILDLLSPNCADSDKPKALTAADLSYLRALYGVFSEQSATLARDEIYVRMRRDLAAH